MFFLISNKTYKFNNNGIIYTGLYDLFSDEFIVNSIESLRIKKCFCKDIELV